MHSQYNPLALSASEGLDFGDETQYALAHKPSTERSIPISCFVTLGSDGVR